MSAAARLRRWYWRHIRRHHFECCHACGRPVRVFWLAPNDVWLKVMGSLDGLRCIPCFDREAGGLEWTCAHEQRAAA